MDALGWKAKRKRFKIHENKMKIYMKWIEAIKCTERKKHLTKMDSGAGSTALRHSKSIYWHLTDKFRGHETEENNKAIK